MRGQFNLRLAFIAIAWLCVALGIYRLIPLPRDDNLVYSYWLGSTVFLCWIGVGLGGVFRWPILGGVLGAMLGFAFAFLSVQ